MMAVFFPAGKNPEFFRRCFCRQDACAAFGIN